MLTVLFKAPIEKKPWGTSRGYGEPRGQYLQKIKFRDKEMLKNEINGVIDEWIRYILCMNASLRTHVLLHSYYRDVETIVLSVTSSL